MGIKFLIGVRSNAGPADPAAADLEVYMHRKRRGVRFLTGMELARFFVMNWEVFNEKNQERSYLLVLEPDEEVVSHLIDFAIKTGLTAAHFHGIGAFSKVTLAYYNWEKHVYQDLPFDGQMEALLVSGNITLAEDTSERPIVHAHAVIGLPDGSTRGGHLRKAWVRPTLELVLAESSRVIQRKYDPLLRFAKLDLKAAPPHRKTDQKAS